MSTSLLELIVESDGAIDGAGARDRFTQLENLLSPASVHESLVKLYGKLCQPDAQGNGHFDHLTQDDFGLVMTAVELVLLRFILMADVLPRPDGANANEN
jgi:hypothetical protein